MFDHANIKRGAGSSFWNANVESDDEDDEGPNYAHVEIDEDVRDRYALLTLQLFFDHVKSSISNKDVLEWTWASLSTQSVNGMCTTLTGVSTCFLVTDEMGIVNAAR